MSSRPQLATITVYLLEHASAIRTRQLRMLEGIVGVRVVGTGTDAETNLPTIKALHTDVVLVGLRGGQPLWQIRLVAAALPRSIVIVLTNSAAPLMRMACLKAGGSYCFDKTLEVNQWRASLLKIADAAQLGLGSPRLRTRRSRLDTSLSGDSDG
ncbi:DNA-binding response regulator [Cupriavidus sp. WKF15]|uniref:DNA-binding response regulator n=1 Tax=Cupriavidus sp. WKF15 TaxID=3032282 RepID=UPI0023E1015A|nr:DNA-binding response regulator [Cupriavidus sp. WKF15]WER48923.1 DNA-binding response regulator [Cupriavidus sp. WKF15]